MAAIVRRADTGGVDGDPYCRRCHPPRFRWVFEERSPACAGAPHDQVISNVDHLALRRVEAAGVKLKRSAQQVRLRELGRHPALAFSAITERPCRRRAALRLHGRLGWRPPTPCFTRASRFAVRWSTGIESAGAR